MSQDHFSTQHLHTNLRQRVLRGGAVTMTGQMAKLIINLVGIVVLARLLTPNDYGLVAMVVAVTSLLAVFKTLGLMDATVQGNEINHQQVSTLFFINVLTGGGLFLMTLALAPLLAAFYNEPRVMLLTLAQGTVFIIGGLYLQHLALLRRQMRYGTVVGLDILNMATTVAVSIALALLGFGYWSLVVGAIAAEVAVLIAAWMASRWRPGWHFRWNEVGQMVRFGLHLQFANFLAVIPIKLDNILIGRFWGGRDLGIYSRAFSLAFLPLEQFIEAGRAIAVPTLSRLQNDPEKFRRYYLKALSLMTMALMPAAMFCVVMSEELIGLVLGKQWAEVAPIFRALCFIAFVIPIGESHKWINISLGRGQVMFKISVVISITFISAVVVGLSYGPLGVATAISGLYWFILFPVMHYALKDTPLMLSDVIRTVLGPFVSALCAGIAMLMFKWASPEMPDFLRLMGALGITAVVVLFVSTWFAGERNPKRFLINSVSMLKELKGRSA